jgi:hypothetical protein
MPPGTVIYVQEYEKYFVLEDDCEECIDDWNDEHTLHFDLWLGPPTIVSGSGLIDCEGALSLPVTMVQINPPSNLTVDTTPLFDSSTNTCSVPTTACVDVGTTCGNRCEIPSAMTCPALATLFDLSLPRFQALNPSLGCSGSVASGTSVCMGGTCGD